jgi:DNA-binding transcriptional MerR regulator
MAAPESFTLTEIARKLDVPQHRLIHLCEKGVVIPEHHDAAGRGSSRVFSSLNYLELAVALRLRDMFVPVAVLRGVMYVLRQFGGEIDKVSEGAHLVDQLRQPDSPEMQIVFSDGQLLYFLLRRGSSAPQLFGGIPLQSLSTDAGRLRPARQPPRGQQRPEAGTEFGGPEGSQFVRMALSINAMALSLELD